MKKLFLIFLLSGLCVSNQSFAETETSSRWSFGGGVGSGTLWALNLAFLNDSGEWIQNGMTAGFILGRYDLSPRIRLRLLGGAGIIYGEEVKDGKIFPLPVLNLGLDFHFKKSPKSFDPYLPVGVGLPEVYYVGFGNEFHFKNNVSIFAEATVSSLLIYSTAAIKVGILKHF